MASSIGFEYGKKSQICHKIWRKLKTAKHGTFQLASEISCIGHMISTGVYFLPQEPNNLNGGIQVG
jgi:hypothetical protein